MNTTSSVTPISENPKQPQQRQTAKDIIAANVKSLIEQLEAGHSDALTAYLDAMSRTIADGQYIHLVSLHQQHERFAKVWDNNLRLQGFAEAFEQQQTPRA